MQVTENNGKKEGRKCGWSTEGEKLIRNEQKGEKMKGGRVDTEMA